MFSICVECERPGANTWRNKNCIFLQIRGKTLRRKPSKTVGLPKKTGLTKKNAKTVELCDSSFKHIFTKQNASLQGICFFILLMAGPCNLYI